VHEDEGRRNQIWQAEQLSSALNSFLIMWRFTRKDVMLVHEDTKRDNLKPRCCFCYPSTALFPASSTIGQA